MASPPTLYIIDGYAQFFRAYHAIRTPMTSPVTKEPTNMTFGFIGMLLKLLRGEEAGMGGRPDYVAVTLDVSGDRGTFRSQLYPEYKATRPPIPEDLPAQIERCLSVLETLGVPVIGAEGYEADDVIASLVTELRETHPDLRVRIVSKDKDLKQLLTGGGSRNGSGSSSGAGAVEIYDVHKDEIIDEASLRAESGITPDQVIDMLALMGDTIDNVPGVPGVGPKTAAQLISEFGSLDAVIAEVTEDKPKKDWKIKGKRRENITAAAETLPLSRKLVTLARDVDAPLDLEQARPSHFKLDELMPILKELGFNRYQDELRELMGGDGGQADSDNGAAQTMTRSSLGAPADSLFASIETPVEIEGDYRCVKTKRELDALVKTLEKSPVVSLDVETTGLSPFEAELCGISLATEPGKAWYVPVLSPERETHQDLDTVLTALKPVIENPETIKVGHNLKYDMLVLRKHGVRLQGLTAAGKKGDKDPLVAFGGLDTMVGSYLIDASRSSHKMDALALAVLKRESISLTELLGTGNKLKTFDTVSLDRATPYACEDADVALQLARVFAQQLTAMGLVDLAREVEMPLVHVLAELEWNGIKVDPDELDLQRERLEKRLEVLRKEIREAAIDEAGRGFDPDSPRQLASILFNKPEDDEPGLGIRPKRKTKTGYSTDSEVLEKLASDVGVTTRIPDLILEYRQLTKLVSTYLLALKQAINPHTGRVHASFNQTVAATGRLSSSDPNLQNIPIRTDLGREIRKAFVAPEGRALITADYSQIELRLLAHLSEDPNLIDAFNSGRDIHREVAAQIHGVTPEDVDREQRNGAKMVNFGIVYGITPYGLARRLGISNTEAEEIITGYKRRFAGITTFLEECIAQARRFGYVETMLKRRRPIPDIESRNPQRRSLAERMAINSVVQGSAADLIKLAMVETWEEQGGTEVQGHAGGIPASVKMLLQIHDELVFEAPVDEAEAAKGVIKERMQGAMSLKVPLVVDAHVSENWYEGK